MKASGQFNLIKEDLKKIGVGFLLAIGGAIIAFLTDVTNIIDYAKYGVYGPILQLGISSLAAALINLIRKWMSTSIYK